MKEEKFFRNLLEANGYPVLEMGWTIVYTIIYYLPPQGEDIWDKLIDLLDLNNIPSYIFPSVSRRYSSYTLVYFVILLEFDRSNPEDLKRLRGRLYDTP